MGSISELLRTLIAASRVKSAAFGVRNQSKFRGSWRAREDETGHRYVIAGPTANDPCYPDNTLAKIMMVVR
jgi:hypothetical protein